MAVVPARVRGGGGTGGAEAVPVIGPTRAGSGPVQRNHSSCGASCGGRCGDGSLGVGVSDAKAWRLGALNQHCMGTVKAPKKDGNLSLDPIRRHRKGRSGLLQVRVISLKSARLAAPTVSIAEHPRGQAWHIHSAYEARSHPTPPSPSTCCPDHSHPPSSHTLAGIALLVHASSLRKM